MKRVLATAIVLLLVSSLACAAGSPQAQGTAQINGIVKDPSGAVLPGVEVTATQTATSISRQAVSDERGNFGLPNLRSGHTKSKLACLVFVRSCRPALSSASIRIRICRSRSKSGRSIRK